MRNTNCEGRYTEDNNVDIRMIRTCKSCGKEFQNFSQGVVYSSVAIGILDFCSDVCCMNYLNNLSTKR
jgi:hypothetical protein